MSDNAARAAPHQSGQRPPSVSADAPSELREYRERSAVKDPEFARKSEQYQRAKSHWLNVHQLCDGDLAWLERREAEKRLIDEL